jgi:hypothetical protein
VYVALKLDQARLVFGKRHVENKKKRKSKLFFAKSTFFHAGQREKKSFFHAKITFFHAGITFFHAAASSVKKSDSRVKKSDSSVKKSSSSVKKSTFFHAREKVIKSRSCMFRGGWELL